MKVLVSACLLGENCKYNGGNNRDEKVLAFLQDKEVIPVCPERILGMPRTPMEIVNGALVNRDGETVDGIVRGQIEQIMQGLRDQPVDLAVLKSRSPTCGVKQVYDGTFSRTLIDGSGVLAQALQSAGIPTIDAEDL
ncbi:MAG: DUF523 domain-containing protein [Oscillospiraceae bacterium]|nr:DUF523 domain-containing protein [Oscillospiraceae bacterium]